MVPVILNTVVTKELVDSVKPDVIIAATGTTPVVPRKIPGWDKDIVVLGTDVLSGKANTGHNVVVIGGGHAGAETANHIASYMKNVTIVELQEDIAMDEVDTPRNALLADLEKNKVRVCASTSVSEIKDHSVVVSGKFNEEIECDTVVISHRPTLPTQLLPTNSSRPDTTLGSSVMRSRSALSDPQFVPATSPPGRYN